MARICTESQWWWDFGTLQLLQAKKSGAIRIVHGGGEQEFADGPFALQSFEDDWYLIGVNGDDETRSIHKAERMEPIQSESVSVARPPVDFKALVLDVRGFSQFSAGWLHRTDGYQFDDSNEVIWLRLPWLMDYLHGEGHDARLACKSVRRWRQFLFEFGLDGAHITDSVKAKSAKRMTAIEATSGTAAADEDYCVSVPALVMLLCRFSADGRSGRATKGALCEKASAVLSSVLRFAFKGQSLKIVCEQADFSVEVKNGHVDHGALAAVMQSREEKRPRIGVAYFGFSP